MSGSYSGFTTSAYAGYLLIAWPLHPINLLSNRALLNHWLFGLYQQIAEGNKLIYDLLLVSTRSDTTVSKLSSQPMSNWLAFCQYTSTDSRNGEVPNVTRGHG